MSVAATKETRDVTLEEFALEIEAMITTCFEGSVEKEGNTFILTLLDKRRFRLSLSQEN